MPDIPDELLHAVATPQGTLALVIGAGASVEAPTSIPAARKMARNAHAQLLRNGTLAAGECDDPEDLAALTSLVHLKTGSQVALVRELPLDHLKSPSANRGHKALVALMVEGAISHVLSLNFDHAVQAAAMELGLHSVGFICNPGDMVPARPTLIHLHRDAYADPEDLILRVEALNDGWKQGWEQVVAQQILAAPLVLFIGLGSPAPVLSQTVNMISAAVGEGKSFFQADIIPFDQSQFAQQLGIPEGHYIEGGWCDVMLRLAARLAEEQVDAIGRAGQELLSDHQAPEEAISRFGKLVDSLRGVSLLTLGLLRARCRLHSSRYIAQAVFDTGLFVEPLAALAEACEAGAISAEPLANGLWGLKQGQRPLGNALIVTGGGTRNLTALEPYLDRQCEGIKDSCGYHPDVVLVGGVLQWDQQNSAPRNLLTGEQSEDLIGGSATPKIIVVAEGAVGERLMEIAHA